MRIRILDRILVAVAGLLMLAICAGLVAQVFFHVDIVGKVARVLTSDGTWAKIAIAAACVLLLLLGGYCVLILFRHRGRRDKFITQKTESGDLAISLKTMETMVLRCLEPRKEIETQSIRLENQRDGLDILIRGTVASGISIPLTVDTLQKQIRQYVTACSGVEVKNIRVQIESSGEEAKNAPFAIDAPAATPLLQGAEKAEKQAETAAEPEKAEKQAESADAEAPEKAEEVRETEEPAPQPMISAAESAIAAAENLKKEYEQEIEEEDDRPIHQRLFSTPAEPCIMPLPPEDLGIEKAADEKETDEKAGDEPAEATEDAEPEADETEEEPEWLKAEPEDEPDDDEDEKAAQEEKPADSGKE